MLNCRTLVLPGSDTRFLRNVSGGRTSSSFPRTVDVVGDIDETLLDRCARQIRTIVASGQTLMPVMVHSSGGSLFDAMALISMLDASPIPVVTVCTGQAYSAGALVFSAGTEGYRYMAPDATLMLHEVSLAGLEGSARQISNESRELQRANTAMFARLASNTSRPTTYFSDLVQREAAGNDLYLDAKAAQTHGLTNHIGVPHLEVRISATLHVVTGKWTETAAMWRQRTGRIGTLLCSAEDDTDDDESERCRTRKRKRKRRRRRQQQEKEEESDSDSDDDDSDDDSDSNDS